MANAHPTLILLACGVLTAGAALAAGRPAVPVSQVVSGYRSLRLMTPEPVYVDPELAFLCRGVTPGDVRQAARRAGPHAHTLARIYMSASAAAAFRSRKPYPVGAVIVKDKEPLHRWRGEKMEGKMWAPPPGVAGMIKRTAGYDPSHGDWEYFYFEEPKKVETGRLGSCRSCHLQAAKSGYVFGSWARPGVLRSARGKG